MRLLFKHWGNKRRQKLLQKKKAKVIKLDNTISPFSTFTFLLGSCNGHYQGDVTVLDKSTPQEQAHVAFFKLSCENWMCSIHMGLEGDFFVTKKKQTNCFRGSFWNVLLFIETLTYKSGTEGFLRKSHFSPFFVIFTQPHWDKRSYGPDVALKGPKWP